MNGDLWTISYPFEYSKVADLSETVSSLSRDEALELYDYLEKVLMADKNEEETE
jgi:hypothetical protein